MLRATAVCAALLMAVSGANAIFTFNNNDDNQVKFSNEFWGVTKVKCFGTVISENNDEDRETEFDVCLFGVVGGLIVLIGLYPQFIAQGAPSQFLRRQDNFQPQFPSEFRNPAENFYQPQPSFSQRISRFFSPFVSKLQKSTEQFSQSAESALERFGSAKEENVYNLQHQEVAPKAQEQPAQSS